ncbi:cytochrome c [Frateuria defendens]|uniref:cytochrome c n=1 Tax=Frateuria defendens TaxID=2219559 RepID=UPI0009E35EC3|nr:cytochrome c [Frateuria defendens]
MKRLIATLVLVALAAFAVVLAVALWPTHTRAVAAGDTASPAVVEAGRYAARAGDCIACHTAPGGQPFAGGLPMQTPVGTVYSTNITPDREHGIGAYTLDDFDRAVRHGIAKDDHSLYPAMPYPNYARVTDADLRALYAYFMHGVQPVAEANKPVDIPWPMSMRWPLALWRKLFGPAVVGPDAAAPPAGATAQEAVVARGAYLVEGLGHCGACHSPRGLGMQEKGLAGTDAAFLAGGAPLEGWVAKNLRGDARDGLGGWSEAELVQFLKTGRTDRTAAFGGMTEVVQHSLQYLGDDDLAAIAHYLKSLPPVDSQQAPFQPDTQAAQALWKGDDSARGAGLYVDSCAACHRTDGKGYTRFFPALAGNTVVQAADPTSLISIVLNGNTLPGLHAAPSPITMPPFGWRLSDQQVADVVTFIRGSWGNQAAPVSAAEVARLRRDDNRATTGTDLGPGFGGAAAKAEASPH